jgi:dTDP-4-amino-4,6-dideoxygalactose transaminase
MGSKADELREEILNLVTAYHEVAFPKVPFVHGESRVSASGKVFDANERQRGDLPDGDDHKYTYSHIGYNLKVTDMQAAVASLR